MAQFACFRKHNVTIQGIQLQSFSTLFLFRDSECPLCDWKIVSSILAESYWQLLNLLLLGLALSIKEIDWGVKPCNRLRKRSRGCTCTSSCVMLQEIGTCPMSCSGSRTAPLLRIIAFCFTWWSSCGSNGRTNFTFQFSSAFYHCPIIPLHTCPLLHSFELNELW